MRIVAQNGQGVLRFARVTLFAKVYKGVKVRDAALYAFDLLNKGFASAAGRRIKARRR